MTITERNGCPVPALNDITDPETLTRFEAVARAGGTPFYTDPDKFHVGNELACVQQGAVSEGGKVQERVGLSADAVSGSFAGGVG